MKLTAVKPRPLFSLASVGTQVGMLRYSSVPISAPLTTLVPGGGATNAERGAHGDGRESDHEDEDASSARAMALVMFRHVLGFMGALSYPYPDALPDAILDQVGELVGSETRSRRRLGAALRDELYVQLMKQLDGGAPVAQAERAWRLLALVLEKHPPSDGLENFVEFFLRGVGRADLILQLHLSTAHAQMVRVVDLHE